MGTSVRHKLYLKAKLMLELLQNECHFTPCLMYITSAMFEVHCSNISKDLYFVICLPLGKVRFLLGGKWTGALEGRVISKYFANWGGSNLFDK